ncbi:acyltransferase family protein [Amnibacterium setariae]|uniref:Acyltransferase 3 domain-containing protein n=1 Tax=Amnibacterium setariae TaxID=2306585 RepID=A0A3A1TVI5_9MICO|nr:acyltransferase family protein [Amnibacterium setariae]RIX28273.1 hypothetical protein D1781_12520 [Amnibacterium setariae]
MTAVRNIARASARAANRTVRDPFLDNAKFLLIVLVVIGHDWYPAIDDFQAVKALYMVVYAFHVPAFVLLSGYFSRGFEGRPDQWRKLVLTVLVPYLVFQTAYAAVSSWAADKPFQLHFSGPIYVTWFLLALFVWRASAPLLRSLPRPILLSTAVSLVATVTITDTGFALARVLQLLPWFVIGLSLKPEHIAALRARGVRLAAGAVLVTAGVVAWFLAPAFDVRWLDRQWDAAELGVSLPVDLVLAAGIDLVTAVMVVAALALVPRRRSWLTALGAFTMYPFLLHGLVVRVAQSAGVHDYLIGLGGIGALAITVGAVALAFLLATPAVRAATRWAVEPASLALFRRRPGATAPAASGAAEGRDAREREGERPREMAGSVRG